MPSRARKEGRKAEANVGPSEVIAGRKKRRRNLLST
jgi:hypothetical protein